MTKTEMELPMTKITPALSTAALLALSLQAAPAQATTLRTFVSAHGNDANPCTLPAPCKTFAAAILQTTAGGIIDVLDPAGYGAVTIDKSITINGRDWASTLVTAGNAITINAGPGDVVNLRGLIIDGAGAGFRGVEFNTGGTLNVQNSVIRRFTGSGIYFAPNASSKLFVSTTLASDNGGSGILVIPSGTGVTVTASLNRVEADNNGSGVFTDGTGSTGTVKVTVTASVAANNAGAGFFSSSTAGQAATSVMLVRCVAVNNGTIGIESFGTNATLRSARSTVTGNTTGWSAASGGLLFTYGDNNIDGNTSDGGAPSVLATR
jgi:hypothetical protein